MKISLNWIKDYINLNGISVDEIVEKLTTSGLEIEEVIDEAKNFENIVVGFVKEVKKHPNADKLSLCIVNDGQEDFQVVCGAPNVAEGQKAVFAKVGAELPGAGFKLKKAKIRGEVSLGMLCAEDELGLGPNHDGIMVLDESAEIGKPFSEFLNKNDVILDIAVTPNRADALSHIGVARDLSALFDRALILPEVKFPESDKEAGELARVIIENETDCPRYVAKVITDVEITESPEWLKEKLLSIDLRPINNIVDATNFVLHEFGQPLHAFDLDLLTDKTIVVKNVKDGTKFVTLDGKERILKETDLMICDTEKPVAIAGVMGGENSEVTENTKNILIESAFFRPSAVRKTSKRLGLSTDASFRFERGCNPDIAVHAANRAAQLIVEIAKGKIAKGELDVYPNKIDSKIVTLRFSRLNKVLGFEIAKDEVLGIFEKLQFRLIESSENDISFEVPLFRHDIEREIDLVEEVARIYGFDRIPAVEKVSVALEEKIDQTKFDFKLRRQLTGLGYYEIITNSLLNEDNAKYFDNPISVLSPQTIEMSHARTSLIPGMLQTISGNIRVKEKNLKLFEIGHVFKLNNGKEVNSFDDITENEHLLLAVTGKKLESIWYDEDTKFDFYDLAGTVDELLRKNSFDRYLSDNYILDEDKVFDFHIEKKFKKEVIIIGGKVKKELLSKYKIDQDVFLFDFNLDLLQKINTGEPAYHDLLKFPKVVRDFAFILDKNILYSDIVSEIKKGSSKLLKKIKLFDIFESESLGAGKKSMAFQLEYYDEARTLTEEEIEKDFWNVIERIKSKFNAELRGS